MFGLKTFFVDGRSLISSWVKTVGTLILDSSIRNEAADPNIVVGLRDAIAAMHPVKDWINYNPEKFNELR